MTATQQIALQRRIETLRAESFALVDELVAASGDHTQLTSAALVQIQDAANKLGTAYMLLGAVPTPARV